MKLLKVGRILRHTTRSANKVYHKSKLYLRDDSDVNKDYELYDLGKVHLAEWEGHIKGKGMLIFIPDKPRLRKDIKM